MEKRITLATIKSFIRKNTNNLFINFISHFDGMTDCVEYNEKTKFQEASITEEHKTHQLGIKGAWFVGSSRDRFNKYEDDNYIGYEIYNCCGSFILVTKKEGRAK